MDQINSKQQQQSDQQQQSKRPLVPIQGYNERSGGGGGNGPQQPQLSSRYRGGGGGEDEAASSQDNRKTGTGSKVSRKSSFHEIQLKFRSLERKQKEKKELAAESKKKQKQLERALSKEGVGGGEWPKSDRDTGYVSRDKSRSRDDFLAAESASPQESLLNASSSSKRLESYLIRQARAADDFDVLADQQENSGRPSASKMVKRQASRCSSLATGGNGNGSSAIAGSGIPGQYRRNMEAVGEFERVWSIDNEPEKKKVPLTRELSPEFRRSKSPVRSNGVRNSRGGEASGGGRRPQQQQRGRSPESRNQRLMGSNRGQSSPPELRRALSPSGPAPRTGRQGPLPPPPVSQLPHRGQSSSSAPRRALSPDLRRSSSRVGAMSPDPARVLRREKTSVFDNRYPSLDARAAAVEKRMSMAAAFGGDHSGGDPFLLQDGVRSDLRRRSYHELHYPPQLGPPPPPPHFDHQFHPHHPFLGAASAQHNFQHSGKKKEKAPKPPDYSRYPGLDLGKGSGPASGGSRDGPAPERKPGQHVLAPGIHPPAPTQWLGGPPLTGPPPPGADPRFFHHPHPMMGPPGPPPPQGRFRGGPMRHY